MKSLLRTAVGRVHPVLLAGYPILFFYAANIETLRFGDVARALGASVGAALVLLVVLSALLRDVGRGAFLASVVVVLFFTYGHLHKWLTDALPIEAGPFGWHIVLMPLWVGLLAVGITASVRGGEWVPRANRFLGIVGGLLVALSVTNIGLYEGLHRPRYDSAWLDDLTVESVAAQRPQQPPDIYYIVLDEYSRDDILLDLYGYDNHAFTDYLTGRGFYVAEESRANYDLTFLSLGSALNMQYLDALSEGVGRNESDKVVAFDLVTDNLVTHVLRGMGYRVIHFSSGWAPTDRNPSADMEFYDQDGLTRTEREIALTTWLRPGMPVVNFNQSRRLTLTNFETITQVPQMEGPNFVFAHFILPHGPYVFRTDEGPLPANGTSVDGIYTGESDGQVALYLEQVGFANRMVRQLVEDILASSEVPPIIIIQGDHGRREQNWGAAEYDSYVMPILNAYYLSGDGSEALYPSISPVNSFRVVLNAYFGTELGLLEDNSYYSDFDRPYGLVELPTR